MNHNIIPMQRRPINDMDVMVRLCSSPAQQRRRMERRKSLHRKHIRTQVFTSIVFLSIGTALGFILSVML